jgi:hypothetical protein
VGGVVADQLQPLGVAIGDDRDRGAIGQRRRQVAQLAVDADRQRRPRQAGADRRGRRGARRPVGQLQRRAVGQGYGDLRRGRGDAAMLPVAL